MSELSDAFDKAYAAQQKPAARRPTPPSPAAKPTPSAAPYDPLGLRKRVSTGDPRIAATRQQVQNAQKSGAIVQQPINEILGYSNTGGIVAGALMLDHTYDRDPYRDPNSATSHAFDLLGKGKSVEAGDLYFPTSQNATKLFAQAGVHPSQYLQAHPRVAAMVDGASRFLDPTNVLFGEVSGDLGRVAETGTRFTARGAGKVLRKTLPEEYRDKPFVRGITYAEQMLKGKRFGVQRGVAEDIARKQGKSAREITRAGDDAEMLARNLANTPEYSRAEGLNFAQQMFGNANLADQKEVMHLHEETSDLLKTNRPTRIDLETGEVIRPPKLTPEEQARFDKLMPAVNLWRKYGQKLDQLSKRWVGDDSRFLSPHTFFPRKGMVLEPNADPLSAGEKAVFEQARSGGGLTARKGTLGEDKHRVYATAKDVEAAAEATGRFKITENWAPKDSIASHVTDRTQANRLYDIMRGYEKLGLIQSIWKEPPITKKIYYPTKPKLPLQQGPRPEEIPDALRVTVGKQIADDIARSKQLTLKAMKPGLQLTPDLYRKIGVGVTKPAIRGVTRTLFPGIEAGQPEGWTRLTELGDLRSFGLPFTRDAYVHPAVADAIREVQAGIKQGISGPLGWTSSLFAGINRIAAQWQVLNPAYHLGVNLRANIASALKTPDEWLRFVAGARSPRALARAKATGAYRPYSIPEAIDVWKKEHKTLGQIMETFQNISAKPLYKNAEPLIAAGLQHALTPRLGRSGAALEVRSVLGEPENIPTEAKQAAQLFEFPAWFASQMRRWVSLPFRRPEIYNSLQATVKDYNASRGRGTQPGDETRMFPPIMLGHDKFGNNVVLNLPHPADRPLRFTNSVMNMFRRKSGASWVDPAIAISGAFNPSLQALGYSSLQALKEQGRRPSLQQEAAAAAPQDENAIPIMQAFGAGVGQAAKDVAFYGTSLIPQVIRTETAGQRRRWDGKMVDAKDLHHDIVNSFVNGNKKWGKDYRIGIGEMRAIAYEREKNGKITGPDGSEAWTAAANRRYAHMQRLLKQYGFDPDPNAPMTKSYGITQGWGIPEAFHAIVGR